MRSRRSEESQRATGLIEELHILKCRIDDIDDSLMIDCDVLGSDESTRVRTGNSEGGHQFSRTIELLKLAVQHVGDIHAALIINSDAERTDELTGPLAGRADRAQQLATGAIKHFNVLL